MKIIISGAFAAACIFWCIALCVGFFCDRKAYTKVSAIKTLALAAVLFGFSILAMLNCQMMQR